MFRRPRKDDIFYDDENDLSLQTNEKLRLKDKLKQISQEQLGLIVHLISNKCSSALVFVDPDKCQILVDRLDQISFN